MPSVELQVNLKLLLPTATAGGTAQFLQTVSCHGTRFPPPASAGAINARLARFICSQAPRLAKFASRPAVYGRRAERPADVGPPFPPDEMSEESTCLAGPFHVCRAASNRATKFFYCLKCLFLLIIFAHKAVFYHPALYIGSSIKCCSEGDRHDSHRPRSKNSRCDFREARAAAGRELRRL